MSANAPVDFGARRDCLDDALGFVEDFCAAHGVSSDDTLRLRLIVEELFTNTVEHGHGGDTDGRIGIALAADEHEIRLAYDDDATPFDPLRQLQAQGDPGERPAHEHRVGGLGLHLVGSLATRIDYHHEGGRNRLRVVVRRRGQGL